MSLSLSLYYSFSMFQNVLVYSIPGQWELMLLSAAILQMQAV